MFKIAFILLLLALLVIQAHSIKFFTKKAEDKPKDLSNPVPPTNTQKKDIKQITPQKPVQAKPQQKSKPLPPPSVSVEIKPETSTSTPAIKPSEKPQPKPSSDSSLDNLFGQPSPKKSQQTSSVPTVKAQQHKAEQTLVTVSAQTGATTTPETDKKPIESKGLIGGLFDTQKQTKPQKEATGKQQKPETQTHQTHQTHANSQQKPNKQQKKEREQKKQDSKKSSEPVIDSSKEKKTDEESEDFDANKKQNQKSLTKESNKPKLQQQKQSQKDSESDQDQSIYSQPNKSKSKEQDSDSDEIIYSKKSPKQSQTDTQKSQQNPQDAKQKYSLTLFMTFCLYSLIIVLVVITIKCTNSSSKLVRSVQIMAVALWHMFLVKKGYREMPIEEHDQQVTQKQEEITVGYRVQDNNKQIFWEKNSVEGI